MKKSLGGLVDIVCRKAQAGNTRTLSKIIWFELKRRKQLHQIERFFSLVEQKFLRDKNILKVYVYSAHKLTESEMRMIGEKIKNKYAQELDISFEVDKDLIGGLKIYLNDEVWDLSWAGKIERMKIKLKGI